MRQRVVISGLGVLSCAGADAEEFRHNVTRGACCLTRLEEARGTHGRSRYAGLLTESGAARLRLEPGLEGHDRFVHMALVAAREALATARASPGAFGRRLGLVFSTCSGPMLTIEAHYERLLRGEGALGRGELLARRYYSGGPALANVLGVEGFCTTVVTACSASNAAIGLAADLIRGGWLDAVLAGGSDAFATSTLAGFDGLKATSEDQCAPFSKPFGLNLGEAACFLFLESLASAERRGAPLRAELLGAGTSNDAYHCSAPDPSGRGLAAAMSRALRDAGLPPEAIGYINAHGTGTEANDRAECRAMRRVFGERAERLPVSSTKSQVGHCLGAAGAVEVAASILCAESGVLPPTANYAGPREQCVLDCVPEAGRPWPPPRVLMSNNAAFGGHNASVVLSVPPAPPRRDEAATASIPVYLTACGAVSALGIGIAAHDEACQAGRSGVAPLDWSGLRGVDAGLVDEQRAARYDRRLDFRTLDRSSRWALLAARVAMREAGFPETPAALADLGLFLCLSAGPSWAESEFLTAFLKNNRQVAQLAAFPYLVPNSVAGQVCRALRLRGHNLTLSTGPGGGITGLGAGLAALRNGHATALLCGAVDELTERILTDTRSAAASRGADPIPSGEGAVVFLLETEDGCRQRRGRPLAVVEAFACCRSGGRHREGGLVGLEDLLDELLSGARAGASDVQAVCLDGLAGGLADLPPRQATGWGDRHVTLARHTGLLEGAQGLLDLAVALRRSGAGDRLLALSLSVSGTLSGVVLKRVCDIDSPAVGP